MREETITPKKKLLGTVLILLVLILSLIRENVFLIVNGVILGTGSYKANTSPPAWLVHNFSPSELALLKWPVTGLFCLVFMALTIVTIRVIFNNKMLIKWVFWFYGILIAAGILFIAAGYLTGTYETLFRWAHFVFTIIQSPIVLLVTFALSFAIKHLKFKDKIFGNQ